MSAARRVIAIDLGAASGRVALASWDGRHGRLDEVHRFEHAAVEDHGHLIWDADRLWDEIQWGILAAARQSDGPIDAIGVDGWAVDYALVGAAGQRVAPVFAYRDERNPPAMRRALAVLPAERIYAITGIQFLPFNTLYQLQAHIAERPREWEQARVWLNLPEYFLYRLSGEAVAEYTNATHTQMLDAGRRQWSAEIAGAFGLDLTKFPPVVPPGTVLGTLRSELASRDARLRDTKVVAPACHDTGAAVAGLPFAHEGLAFISSGTWSLVGTVLDAPVLTDAARRANFTNEGGVGGTIRFLSNVIGLWLLQQSVAAWRAGGLDVTEAGLSQEAARCPKDGPWFDADVDTFMAPGDMVARITAALARRGHEPIVEPVEITAAIFRSLARRYAEVIRQAHQLSGKRFDAVCVAGGGVRNKTLTAWTQASIGLPIVEGPAESATLGNAAIQIAALEGSCTATDIQEVARGLALVATG